MKKRVLRSEGGLVYSTQGGTNRAPDASHEEEERAPSDQLLYVSIDKKQRKGKEVTLIEGFKGPVSALVELGKTLKSKCGTGGTAKEGVILVQGNFREKIASLLESEGYKVKKKGG